MEHSEDGRIFTRSTTKMGVEITSGAGVFIDAQLQDISMSGLRVRCTRTLPVGGPCGVAVVLDGGTETIRLKADGRVVRSDETGMAIEFTELDDQSLEHLRNLVLYNSPDAERADDEMQHNPGIKGVREF